MTKIELIQRNKILEDRCIDLRSDIDDFESRTCESCINYREKENKCFPLDMRVNSKFGCNLWKAKDD